MQWEPFPGSREVGCFSACETKEDHHGLLNAHQVVVAESADPFAYLGPWDCGDFVDHQAAWLLKPIDVVWLDQESKEWRFGGI